MTLSRASATFTDILKCLVEDKELEYIDRRDLIEESSGHLNKNYRGRAIYMYIKFTRRESINERALKGCRDIESCIWSLRY